MSTMTARFTGAGNIVATVETVAPGVEWALEFIRLHLSAAGAANNLTATIDSGIASWIAESIRDQTLRRIEVAYFLRTTIFLPRFSSACLTIS